MRKNSEIIKNPLTRKFEIDNLTFYKTKFMNAVFKQNCISNFNYEAMLFPAVSDETVLMNIKLKPCLPKNLVEINDTKKLYAWYNEAERIYICGSKDRDKVTEQKDRTSPQTTKDLSNAESSTSSPAPKTKKTKRTEANVALIDKTYYYGGDEATRINLHSGELEYFDVEKDDLATFKFRGLAKLKKGHKAKTKEVLFNCVENKTLFLSFNSGNKYSIDELQLIVQAFQRWVKRNFENNLKYAVIVYEPNQDGSWHFHCLLCFAIVPDNFQTCFAEWANNYNNKQGIIKQTDVQLLESKDDILRVWNYLNPTSEKKRERAVYYPQNFHNIVSFGNRDNPPSMKVTGATLQEFIEKTEAVETSAEQVIVMDNETGEVNEYAEYWFKLDKAKLDKMVSQTIMDAIYFDDDEILTFSLSRVVENGGAGGSPLATIPSAVYGRSSIVPTTPTPQLYNERRC